MNKELHVNLDHIATLRKARRTVEPRIIDAIKLLENTQVAGITLHLREDRRHIEDKDIYEIDKYLRRSKLGFTFEMAATSEIRDICLQTKAQLATLVPEKREEVTTEGGLDLESHFDYLKEFIKPFAQNDIKVSLFVDPDLETIKLAKEIGADAIELHTGVYANLFLNEKNLEDFALNRRPHESVIAEAKRLHKAADLAKSMELQVNMGHGLTINNLPFLLEIDAIKEFHIGHSIIANSVFKGIESVCNEFTELLNANTK